MKEILSLSYDASTRAVVATLAHTKESEHVPGVHVRQMGMPDFTERVSIDDVPELRAAIEGLVAIVESRSKAKGLKDPDLIAAHAELSRKEEQLAKNEIERREALGREEAERRAQIAAVDASLIEARTRAEAARAAADAAEAEAAKRIAAARREQEAKRDSP